MSKTDMECSRKQATCGSLPAVGVASRLEADFADISVVSFQGPDAGAGAARGPQPAGASGRHLLLASFAWCRLLAVEARRGACPTRFFRLADRPQRHRTVAGQRIQRGVRPPRART